MSLLDLRRKYVPAVPKCLVDIASVSFTPLKETTSLGDLDAIKAQFPRTFGRPILAAALEPALKRPLKIGVVFSGGQAPGGHNVITGLYDALMEIDKASTLFGFLGGPSGIVDGKYLPLTGERLAPFRNCGGFDLIGSGRTKLETKAQLEKTQAVTKQLSLDGLVIIGGDDSNTNAAVLAEYFLENKHPTCVIGIPKTIDGDLKSQEIETSFGFDTACKTYSEMIGNICRDALSAKKYYHFIKLMGRAASHIALECALQSHPNLTLISEEIAQKNYTLEEIVGIIADLVVNRFKKGKNYGVIVIPEGLIEFIPELKALIDALNQSKLKEDEALSADVKRVWDMLPKSLQQQLRMDRDPHGNIQLSHVKTETLLLELTEKKLANCFDYKGKFAPVCHFFGYEGRCAYPSHFDANYCYGLGRNAAALIARGLTGYISALKGLSKPVLEWEAMAVPITSLMHLEERKGTLKPVIRKALVDLHQAPFQYFAKNRAKWQIEDHYQYVGPIQYFGQPQLVETTTLTLSLENA